MDNERTFKQNYLRNEIMEKSYNSEQFLSYLSELKGDNAVEIDNWTLDELKQAVNSFKSKIGKESPTTHQRTDSQGCDNITNTSASNITKTELSAEIKDLGSMPKDVNFSVYLVYCGKL